MKDMPKVGAIIRFAEGPRTVNEAPANKIHVGYVTRIDTSMDMVRVCTSPGNYWWVDRALAEAV